jgi:ADP-dependent NAD(P)H-hydrate dehydratase
MSSKQTSTPKPTRITALPPLPVRPESGHKGLFGRVLIVGGSDSMIGAPVLAGTAALRCGAGLVQIALPKDVLPAALSITPELIGLALGRNDEELLEAAEQSDVIVAGPGLGKAPGAKKRVKHLIRIEKSMVLDADALNILAAEEHWPTKFRAQAVLTPHPGEMKRLARLLGRNEVPTDEDGRIEIATAAAIAFGQVVVLKGHQTVVADGKRVFINRTGDSSLSKAGTGDVLSGILGAFLGQKMDRFDAACAAVHIHGRAGEIAGLRLGRRSVLARDVIDALSESLCEYEKVAG